MKHRIYLDHNATTPLDPSILKILIHELSEIEGNPSSIHMEGQKARKALENSRQIIARYLNVKPQEIIFTSGGTEGASLLLQGFFANTFQGHMITSNVEHSCIYQTVKNLERRGCEVTFLPVGLWGAVKPESLKEAIQSNTKLIVLTAVNNETGVMTDIEAVACIAEEAGIPLIVDGVAWLGKENFSVHKGISALFFSGHKIHAPKGIGVVFVRQNLKLTPLFFGGGQEYNRRAGTQNLPAIIAFAGAVELLISNQSAYTAHMCKMRDRLEDGIKKNLKEISINGMGPRVCNTTNISFLGVDGESLLMGLDREGLAVSHGSACASGAREISRILLNMGLPLKIAQSAIRFSTSRFTTESEIDKAVELIVRGVSQMRRV